jgi:glutamate-5-semialdehyde dehydrogenase
MTDERTRSGLLTALTAGMAVPFGGDRVAYVDDALAAAFRPGDRLVVVQTDGALLHIPAAEHALVDAAVRAAHEAFARLAGLGDGPVDRFYEAFADRLADPAVVDRITAANRADVASAKARGRSTTRLVLSDKMRADMIAGLRGWRSMPSGRDSVVRRVEHEGWTVEQRRAPLGVVGFVFEGRPNVFADATGVLRSGNTVAMRIGSDALGTARAIMDEAVRPALAEAGLPDGAVVLVDSAAHAAGWALFSHHLLALAVARGSGPTVAQLGAVARQSGVPVSLHGTGGAWMVAGEGADAARFAAAVTASLDRKVCNTLNVACVVRSRAAELVPVLLAAADAAGARRSGPVKYHVADSARPFLPDALFAATITVERATGPVVEPHAEPIAVDDLGTEWEWEATPELSIAVVDDLDQAVSWFNRFSPRLVATLLSQDEVEQERFWNLVDAPFVGNGFTRWVDGQYALHRPELGLSNWQGGRLFGRGGVLSGDSVFTVRTRVTQTDPTVHR